MGTDVAQCMHYLCQSMMV